MLSFIKKHISTKIILISLLAIFVVGSASFTLVLEPKPAEALCCANCCTCITTALVADVSGWFQSFIQFNLHFFIQLWLHHTLWFDWTFWQQWMLPAFQQMGVQLTAVGTNQVMIVGMFMDAKLQLESQRLLQELHAEAHKDYHPSVGMCEFGTRMVSLAASERKGEINALILSERSTDRYLGSTSTAASDGSKADIDVRLRAFAALYCDYHDNNANFSNLCGALAPATSPTQAQMNDLNKDVDYQRVIEDPWTLAFDLTAGGAASEDDQAVIALANNLYGFDSFARINDETLQNDASLNQAQQNYLDMRAVVAKTKVAENSFNALVSLKAEGTAGSRAFISAYLEELGITDPDEMDQFLGVNPSYHAQMEILTKKAYQSQLFYTNLYDKPANIERKGVAMQAIGLIQKFDLLKSYLRTEASLSVLLELTVEQLQREVEDNIRAFTEKGATK